MNRVTSKQGRSLVALLFCLGLGLPLAGCVPFDAQDRGVIGDNADGGPVRCDLAALAPAAVAAHLTVLHPLGFGWRELGSAVPLDSGWVITNRHVVAGLSPGSALLVRQAGRTYQAQLQATSTTLDLALLRLTETPSTLATVKMRSRRVSFGEHLQAAGIRPGAQAPQASEGHVFTSSTAIAPFGQGFIARMPGRPGYSGGPILDSNGELVGMITAVWPRDPADSTTSRQALRRPGPPAPCAPVTLFAHHSADIADELQRLILRR